MEWSGVEWSGVEWSRVGFALGVGAWGCSRSEREHTCVRTYVCALMCAHAPCASAISDHDTQRASKSCKEHAALSAKQYAQQVS